MGEQISIVARSVIGALRGRMRLGALFAIVFLAGLPQAQAQQVNYLSVSVTTIPGTFYLSVLSPYLSNTQPLGLQVIWNVQQAHRIDVWADFASTTAFTSASQPTYTIAANAVEAQSVSGCTVCTAAWTPFGTVTDSTGLVLGTPGAAFKIDQRQANGQPRSSGSANESLNLRVNLTNYVNTVKVANDYHATMTIHVEVF